MTGAVLCMAFYNVWSRPFIRRSSALGFLAVGMGSGAAALVLVGVLSGRLAVIESFDTPQWIAAIYLGVTVLACLGYGAFFLVAGMLFRNPILPAAAILIWEGINPFLPTVLKQFSVIYYLKSLCPVNIPTPPDTPPVVALLISNSDPISAPVAVLGILIVALIALYVSSVQVRRMEINYTTE